MKGLRKYTHKDRAKVIKEMVPLIKKKFGKNLIGLAACASFARHEDGPYSDLELIAFVRKMDSGKKVGGIGKIRNGMMVELVWMTRENYLKEMDITKDWYIAGSDRMLPIVNKRFIKRLGRIRIKNIKKKCLKQAANHWYEAQESTAKVLNAIAKKNRPGIPLLVFEMYLNMLRVLSFLNQKPYKTFATFVAQARKFTIKPKHFGRLTRIIIDGKYQNFDKLRIVVERVFAEFERILERQGVKLYDDNVDPSKPSFTDDTFG